MKKFILCLVTCLSFVQSASAMLTNYELGLLFIDSVLNSPVTRGTIPSNECATSIIDRNSVVARALTMANSESTATQVITLIQTADPAGGGTNLAVPLDTDRNDIESRRHSQSHSKHHFDREKVKTYKAVVQITPNPLIGPPIITVISVTRVKPRHHLFNNLEIDE